MAEVITDWFGDRDRWLVCLGEGRRAKVMDKMLKLKEQGLDSTATIECTDICDKRDLIAKVLKGDKVLAGTAPEFTKNLKDIELLRNSLAHAGGYARDEAELRSFIDTVASARRWIQVLSDLRSAVHIDVNVFEGAPIFGSIEGDIA